MSRGRLLLVAGTLAVLGLLDALWLTYMKAEREVSGMTDSSVCHVLSEAGCSVALESPMGVIGGVPVSLVGAAAYLVVLGLIALAALSEQRGPFADSALRLFGWASVGYSVVLGTYSFAQGAPCLFCIGLYIVNSGLWVAAVHLSPERLLPALGGDVRRLLGSPLPLLVAVVLFAGAVAGGQWAYRTAVNAATGNLAAHDRERTLAAFAKGSFPVPMDGAPSVGPADARFTLVEFSDFQCPYCQRLWQSVEELRRRRPNEVRVVFRHSPLSGLCNPLMSQPGHVNACPAAFASICAERQGKFWEMGTRLFENQRSFEESDLDGWASDLGLDVAAFRTCMSGPEVRDVVRHDALLAAAMGVKGTPTFFVNGFQLVGGLPIASLERVLGHIAEHGGDEPINAAVQRYQATIARGPHPIAPSPRRFNEASGPNALEVVSFVDPSGAASRDHLRTLAILPELAADLARVSLRVISTPEDCAGPDRCRPARLLICGVSDGVGGTMAALLAVERSPSDEDLRKLFKEKGDHVLACAAGQGADAALAEDRAAAAALGGSSWPVTFVGGYRIDGAVPNDDVDQVLATALLAREKR